MARQEHILSVFVASPGDVAEERTKLEDVVDELNSTLSRKLGVRLELLHAFPSFGTDAQEVINQQIPQDYDIFIGIMGCRFGTPTRRFGSGTAEEFALAKERHDQGHHVALMFYFKDAMVSSFSLDLEQLQKVHTFRKSLGDEGALYWTYKDVAEFEKYVRMHLMRRLQEWKPAERQSPENSIAVVAPVQVTTAPSGDEDDDIGLFELMDVFQEEISRNAAIMGRITAATNEVGQKVAEQTKDIQELGTRPDSAVRRAAAKHLIGRAARELDVYAARLNAELAPFRESLEKAMDAFLKGIVIALQSQSADERQEDVTQRRPRFWGRRNFSLGKEIESPVGNGC